MLQSNPFYEGKAKRLYLTENPDEIRVEYKDSLTAFNALKKGSFVDKGALNLEITEIIFKFLERHGIKTHWIKKIDTQNVLVKKVEVIPLEVVVRNVLAGSTAKKFGIEEGRVLEAPLVEFYYKDDSLGDPFVSDDQIFMMKICTHAELAELKKIGLQVNAELKKLMTKANLNLVDFKIEIGRLSSQKNILCLADEISPDCCRLWDVKTGEKMDKDRFRRDLGKVEESYREVCNRLKVAVESF